MQGSRRTFVAAGMASLPTTSLVSARPSPSERVTVGVVGLGSRGLAVMQSFLQSPVAQVVAVCDVHDLHYRDRQWGQGPQMGREPARVLVDKHYGNERKSGNYRDCTAYSNYRQLLEREDIDAVIVATPDHWHAQIGMDAIQAGKDVYGEKPVTHFFAEGQQLYQTAAQKKAVFQVGSQQRSDARFRQAVEVVRNGHLGKIQRVEVGLPPGYDQAMDSTNTEQPPQGLDYAAWCGPAERLPYMRARHHRWWRSTRAFGGGVLMDWIGHHNDIAHWAMGADTSGPLSVEATVWTASQCIHYDTPAEYEIQCEYPNEVSWVISSKLPQGVKWIGEDGWLWVKRGQHRASESRWMARGFQPGTWRAYVSNDHTQNFLDCVRSRKACIAPAETGHRSITPGHLGYISHSLGRKLNWNAATERVVNDAEAQQLLLTPNSLT